MRTGNWIRALLASVGLCAGAAIASGPATGPVAAAIGDITPGQWQLREAGSSAPPRTLCVSNPDRLIQLEHPGASCSRILLNDQPRTATISYTCPGAGHGRTMIRLETRNSFHLETQGIAGGAPFDMAFDARRTGDCPAATQ